MSVSLDELCRRVQKLEEAYDYQKKQCIASSERNSDRLSLGAKKMAQHELKLQQLCQWREGVGNTLEIIKDRQNASKNYLIAILVSLVAASIMLALNLAVT